MEIITSFTRTELEQIITDSVQKALTGNLRPANPEPSDLIGIDEASEITGWLKATIYKKSHLGEIPCSRLGKRLVFSRRKLLQFLDSQTIQKVKHKDAAIFSLQRDALRKAM